MKKRIISLILALLIAFGSSIGTFAIGENEPTISLTNTSGNRESDISISVNMANNPGVVSVKLNIGYDSDVLELISVTDKGLLNGSTHAPEYTNNPYILFWSNGTATENNKNNGELAVLNFKIKENASAGDSDVVISIDQDAILDVNMNDVPFSFVNGKVTVNVPATDITLNLTTLTLDEKLDKTNGKQLTATLTPAGSNDTVTWSSNNTTVATVDENGVVKPHAIGEATITATAGSGSATCGVTVADHECKNPGTTYENDDENEDQHYYTCACGKKVYEDHTTTENYVTTDGATQHWKLCDKCDAQLEKAPHKYENNNLIIEQTDGNVHAYQCDDCEHIEETKHNFVLKNGQDPTCIAVGVKEYYKCENGDHSCGLYFEKTGETTYTLIGDEKALEDWKQNGGQIPATGNHSFNQSGWENNEQNHWHKCTTKGCTATDSVQAHNFVYDNSVETTDTVHTLKCSVCGYQKTEDHKWVDKKDNANHWKECSVCGKKKEEAAHIYNYVSNDEETHTYACSCGQTITESHSASGQIQKNGNGHWYVCKCGQIVDYSAHNYEIKDCTQEGTCTVCQYKRAAREHMWNEGEQTKAPTCTEKGETKFTCTSCQETKTEAIDALGHDYANQTPTYTWTENDTKCEASVTCKREGCTHAKTEQATVQYVKDTAATCTEHEKGHYKATFTNAAFSEQNTAKNSVTDQGQTALRHDYGTPVYEWKGDLCTAKKTCTREGCTIAQEGHTVTETKQGTYVEDTPATCVAASTGHYKATFEDSQFEEQSTAANSATNGTAKGHDYGDPTYSWDGMYCTATRTCTRTDCTDAQANHTISKTETGTYVKDVDATCTTSETGHFEIKFTDTQFGNSRTNADSVINGDPLGHDYGTPTYTWSDNDTKCTASVTCKRNGCGHNEQQVSDALYEKESDPTCTEAETGHYTATFTNSHFTAQTKEHNGMNPPLGHNAVHKDGKAATCTESGIEDYWYCDQCEKYYSDEDCTTLIGGESALTSWKAIGGAGYIAPLGHDVHPEHFAKAATCTGEGYKDYWYCSRCKTNFSNEGLTEIITNVEEWKKSGDGYIAALGHQMVVDETKSTAATCTTPGTIIEKCTRPGCAYTTSGRTIDAHHTYDADGVCTVCHKELGEGKAQTVQAAVGKVESGTGENTATVNTPAMDILNAVAGNNGLPANIVEQIADGTTTLTVTFEVKKKNENEAKIDVSVAESYEEKVKETSEKGKDNGIVKISAPIDIDLSMILKNQEGTQINDDNEEIHNLNKPIEIAVSASEEVKSFVEQAKAGGKVVEYFMLRIHGENIKEVEIIEAKFENGKIVFETDKLSTFVPMVVISDPEPVEEERHYSGDTIVIGKRDNKEETKEVEENPNTGAPVPSFGIALVVLGAASVAVSKKRK